MFWFIASLIILLVLIGFGVRCIWIRKENRELESSSKKMRRGYPIRSMICFGIVFLILFPTGVHELSSEIAASRQQWETIDITIRGKMISFQSEELIDDLMDHSDRDVPLRVLPNRNMYGKPYAIEIQLNRRDISKISAVFGMGVAGKYRQVFAAQTFSEEVKEEKSNDMKFSYSKNSDATDDYNAGYDVELYRNALKKIDLVMAKNSVLLKESENRVVQIGFADPSAENDLRNIGVISETGEILENQNFSGKKPFVTYSIVEYSMKQVRTLYAFA